MKIESLVTRLVVRVEASERLLAAARRMWAHEIGALPVFAGDALVGIISERDVVTAPALGASVETAVGAHMTPAPATAELGEDSVAVANRMLDLGVRHLPPVEGGQVVGMVSATDFAVARGLARAAAERSGGRIRLSGLGKGVARIETGKLDTMFSSEVDPKLYWLVDLWFESEQDLEMALRTPEAQAAIADLPTFATGGVTVVTSVVQEELAQVTPGA